MDDQDTPNVLAVGAKLANLARAKVVGDVAGHRASFAEVAGAKEALALVRTMPFDLVAVGTELTDATAIEFATRLRRAKPWQKWLMVSDEALDAEDEAEIRSLGAVAILDGPDAWRDVVEVARRLRLSRPETTVPGLSLGATSV
jgi:CheY-like chemotaxis protein